MEHAEHEILTIDWSREPAAVDPRRRREPLGVCQESHAGAAVSLLWICLEELLVFFSHFILTNCLRLVERSIVEIK